jgi:hypothetical protein
LKSLEIVHNLEEGSQRNFLGVFDADRVPRMLLVVVGNIDRAHVERLVRTTIAQLPRGNYKWTPPPPSAATGRALAIENRALPTNYVLGYVPGPSATSPDYAALRVATAVLSGRLYTEVRSRRNLSYDVEAQFLERANAVGERIFGVGPEQLLHPDTEWLMSEQIINFCECDPTVRFQIARPRGKRRAQVREIRGCETAPNAVRRTLEVLQCSQVTHPKFCVHKLP